MPSFAQNYSMSTNGVELIKHYEGITLQKKNGYIGYGHKVKRYEKYTHITKAKAEQILQSDVILTNKSINILLKPFEGKMKFSQGFIDGFGSFIYNCGEGKVKRSKFYKALLSCKTENDLTHAIGLIPITYCSLKGLKKRRKSEHYLMLHNKLNFKIEGGK